MERIVAHFRLFRPLNLLTGALAVIVSTTILDSLDRPAILIITILVVVCYNAAANAINDYFDYEIDLINRPGRPLSTGLVKRETALIISIILFCAGSIVTFLLPVTTRLIAIFIALPLMVLYSWRLKGLPLIGNIIVAFILGLTFIFAGSAFGIVEPMIIPALLAFGLTVVRELVKDIADFEGDRKLGLKTIPVVQGQKRAIALSVIFSFLIGAGSLIPFWLDYYGNSYLLVLILGIETPLVYIIFTFKRSPTSATAVKAARILKFSTIAGILAVYLG